ncbi:MAG TPA: carboxypeptidase regulatory-like domain-containing protein [Gemmatimonas sp.]|nr:carboxypeptidase regulatory-like domain-containing protein [Gemmatimonas sp.]
MTPSTGTILGTVLRQPAGAPIEGARVQIGALVARSDARGAFRIEQVPAGAAELMATHVGLAPRTLWISIIAGDTVRVYVRLAERAVQLEQIVVTAAEAGNSAQGSSVSRIARDAIEHVQASSLADILQLVPGQPALNPSLAGPRQSLLRQAPTTSSRDPGPGTDAERANALGTSVVLDGVPLSNNANLQSTVTILNSGPSALPPFASTADRGIDLRQIPADQVESVEVVRGVPSARHGDLTAGAIIVTSRIGAQRPELRLRANPLTLETSSVGGWGQRDGIAAALDVNVTRSQDDARSTLDRFTRVTTGVAVSLPADALLTGSLRVRAFGVVDETRQDPDDARSQRATLSRDRGMRTDLRLRAGRPLAGSAGAAWQAEITASLNVAEQLG